VDALDVKRLIDTLQDIVDTLRMIDNTLQEIRADLGVASN